MLTFFIIINFDIKNKADFLLFRKKLLFIKPAKTGASGEKKAPVPRTCGCVRVVI